MDKSIFDIVQKVGSKYNIPMDVLYPIIMTESSGNPLAHNKSSIEDSRGLFQVNVKAHPSANSSMLFNPEYNANFIMPQISQAYNSGVKKGLSGVELAVYTEKNGLKPQWTPAVENNVRKFYSQYQTSYLPSLTVPIPAGNINTEKQSEKIVDGAKGVGEKIIESTGVYKVMDSVKYYLTYAMLLIFLLFCLYMIFVFKGGKS